MGQLEILQERAIQSFSTISDTKRLVESFIDIANSAIKVIGYETGKKTGKIFRIGVTTINDKNIISPIRIIRKVALRKKMFLDSFFIMPLTATSLAPLLESMRGDYINDMEDHLKRELGKGRISVSSQTSLRETIIANMRFPYKAGKTLGFIFFSGDTKGMFGKEMLGFIQSLIHPFEARLEVCNDLDTLISTQQNAIKKQGATADNYKLLSNIQKKLEPDMGENLQNTNLEIFHKCFPWDGHPSGDLINVWNIGNKVAVLIADVVGHGIEAANITIFLRGLFLKEATLNSDLKTVVGKIDRQLRSFIEERFPNPHEMYATAFYGLFDTVSREFKFCNAGHFPPILLKAGIGETDFTELLSADSPLGFPFDNTFKSKSITLSPGDIIIFYTDGITEGENEEREQFGQKRLIKNAADFSKKSAEEIGNNVIAKFKEHTASEKWNDDVSLLIAKVT